VVKFGDRVLIVKPTKQQINDALAAEIRAGLARRDMTVADLAEKTDISFSTMLRITNGADLQVSKLYLIADALKLSPVKMVQAAVAEAERANK
jgi:transcriptional regulator with XRE-family HTH domain